MRLLALLLSVAWLWTGCNTPPATESRSHISSITLERTACFGNCPVYLLTLFEDGLIRYEGREHVKKKGIFTAQVTAADVAPVFQKAEAIGFWKLADHYDGSRELIRGSETVIQLPPTDLPRRFITLKTPTRTKRIEDYWSGPPELRALARLIDTVGHADRWVGSRSDFEPQ